MDDNNARARHGRRQLFGSLDKLGVEFEWHDERDQFPQVGDNDLNPYGAH